MGEAERFRYRPDVLEHLLRHGVQPKVATRPELVRDYVRDLYRYEIRRLRERYLRRDFPKVEYSDRVDRLRRQYPVLATARSGAGLEATPDFYHGLLSLPIGTETAAATRTPTGMTNAITACASIRTARRLATLSWTPPPISGTIGGDTNVRLRDGTTTGRPLAEV